MQEANTRLIDFWQGWSAGAPWRDGTHGSAAGSNFRWWRETVDDAEFDALYSRARDGQDTSDHPEDFALFDEWRASEEDLARAEVELGTVLPATYKEFMRRYGGGNVSGDWWGFVTDAGACSEAVHFLDHEDGNLTFAPPDFLSFVAVHGLRAQVSQWPVPMSRKTRTRQFFAVPDEIATALVELRSEGFSIYGSDLRTTSPWAPGVSCRRVLIARADSLPSDAHREPARWGAVYLDPPEVRGDELTMSELSAVNSWIEGDEGRFDDSVLSLFSTVEQVIARRFVVSADGVHQDTGGVRHFASVRLTADAVAFAEAGGVLRQRSVVTMTFVPHSS